MRADTPGVGAALIFCPCFPKVSEHIRADPNDTVIITNLVNIKKQKIPDNDLSLANHFSA